MDAARLLTPCFSSPIRSPSCRPLSFLSGAFRSPSLFAPFRAGHRRNLCLTCAAETLVTGSRREEGSSHVLRGEKRAETGDLKSWLHAHGLPPCKVVLKERASHDGRHRPIRYIAASEDLEAGDVLFSIPNSLVVTLDRVLGNETIAELLTTNKLSELACLALYLMYEKKQGKKSFWYPFIRELDRQRGRGQLAVESPLLWSETELAYLDGSPTRKVNLARRFALVPLGPPLLAYKSNCKAMLTAVSDAVELVVDRPFKAGEPIVVWCGPQPNSRLLLNYGLVDEDNPYDRIAVEASLNMEDPQYQEKRMVAQRNGKLAVQVFHVFVGREKEAISEMLPYMRLGYVSDPAEMQSVISSQGPICPVSPCMERAVLDQLVGYFEARLAGYSTTLSEDEDMLRDGHLDPKKRVAVQLVKLEKKMLHACLQATFEFINQLPDHTVSPCPAPFAPQLK
ncbi:uncharacterized protein [Elaeis guineensis]|uniref:uncharacterized protein isoform X2 n=1 Tax=Elaeis guineensis var. tenera TaxID=51953 RepID=UPI003C6D092A